nr:hypothetical protein [Caballeronia cordobensis]
MAPVVDLARELYPDADSLVTTYHATLLSNDDPLRVANEIEINIHDAFEAHAYEHIILIGHSMGGMLMRKALVWGYGVEEDRAALGRKGPRAWVGKVDRFVSLASINRGWSIDPKPDQMSVSKYLLAFMLQRAARLLGVGRLLFALERGAPFVADLRVQWIRLARNPQLSGGQPLPKTIHLLGDVDDVVSRDDSCDLAAAKDVLFVTVPNTNHGEIATNLKQDAPDPASQRRVRLIKLALTADREDIPADRTPALEEDFRVKRIVYVMHGIRDQGTWAERFRDAVERDPRHGLEGVRVVPPKYGFFPMGPFLLYWDRQRNVRKFMDDYTENLARYPDAYEFDFIGHSNGTYILASALQHYRTLVVGRVYFAGSVVPKRYPWDNLIDAGRVKDVVNIVATNDWVVALFPRFFEQIAEWVRSERCTGLLDLGSSGFRGFDASGKTAEHRVRDLKFAVGPHGVGVTFNGSENRERRLAAVIRYAILGDQTELNAFKDADSEARWLNVASNLCWLVWVGLAGVLSCGGYFVCQIFGFGALVAYFVVILLLLNSV